jgi:hypothetical protein
MGPRGDVCAVAKKLILPTAGNKTVVLPKILLGYKGGIYCERGVQAYIDKRSSARKE